MQLSVFRDPNAFAALAGEWNALLARSITDVPFLRHEFLSTWWSTRGGGEWPAAELWIAAGREADGQLAGLAPFFAARTRDGRPGLMFVGSIEISDYLDLVVPPEHLATFSAELLQAAVRDGPAGWEVLDLYNIPESSPTLAALEAAARSRGWPVQRQRLEPCPVIRLPADWESYLASLDKKQRHELRRKLRRVETYPGEITWRIVGAGEDIDAAIDTFLTLMALDPNKARFLTEAMRTQQRAAMSAAWRAGWLQLALLAVDGVPASAYLNLDYGERVWVYNSGLNPAYHDLSLGWVLLGYLIRWAIENGRREFDFMRGSEDYKFRLGGVARYVVRLTITRPPAG